MRRFFFISAAVCLSSPFIIPVDIQQKKFDQLVTEKRSSLVKLALYLPRIDPAVNDNQAIRYACRHEDLSMVEVLLSDKRVDPSDENNSCILSSVLSGRTDILKLLLRDERVNPNAYLGIALHFNQMEVFKILAEHPRVSREAADEAKKKYNFRFTEE